MRTAITTLVLVLALLSPAVATAQGLSVGVKGGLSYATIPDFADGGIKFDTESRSGFAGGAFFRLTLLPGLSIQPEAIYTPKGVTAKTTLGNMDIDLVYVDAPVLLRLSFGLAGLTGYVYGGPSFNVLLSAEAALGDDAEDVKDDLEPIEVSAVGGAGIEFGKLLIEARLSEGLKSISKNADEEIKTRTFLVMAGIRF